MKLPSKESIKDFISRNESELTIGGLYFTGLAILSGAMYKAAKSYNSSTENLIDNAPPMIPLSNGDWMLHLADNSWFTFRPTPIEPPES